jgi:hypothetical protein
MVPSDIIASIQDNLQVLVVQLNTGASNLQVLVVQLNTGASKSHEHQIKHVTFIFPHIIITKNKTEIRRNQRLHSLQQDKKN